MQKTITIKTNCHNGLFDITRQVEDIIQDSSIKNGLAAIYAQGATAAIMIQENWDDSVQTDVVNLLKKLIPPGVWLHDRQDGNGDAHLKSRNYRTIRNHSNHQWKAGFINLAKHILL